MEDWHASALRWSPDAQPALNRLRNERRGWRPRRCSLTELLATLTGAADWSWPDRQRDFAVQLGRILAGLDSWQLRWVTRPLPLDAEAS